MRVISGSYKGKKILIPKDKKTRPLKDLTKESIFNIIKHSKKFKIDFSNSFILDLFSGVGSFGIECLSRGVKKVIFIENYPNVLPLLKKNLIGLSFNRNYKIIEKNIYTDDVFENLYYKFDIIFLDPPFKDDNLNDLFNKIRDFKLLKNGGIIILHRHKKEDCKYPQSFKLVEEKVYGISNIKFFTNLN